MLGFLMWAILVIASFQTGFTQLYEFFVYSFAMAILIVVTFVRHRLKLQVKVGFISALVVVVVIANFSGFGLLSNMKVFVALFPVLLSFVLPLRQSIVSMVILLLIYGVFGFLFSQGILAYNFDIIQYSNDFSSWLLGISVVTYGSVGLLFAGYFFSSALISNYTLIDAQHRAMGEKERKYRLLFEKSNDAILIIQNEKYIECNKQTFDLFRCKPEDILNRYPWDVSPKEQPDGTPSVEKAAGLFTKVAAGIPAVFDWQHTRKDGTPFDVSISLTRMDRNDTTYIQAVLRDITRKKKSEAELEKYRNHLEQLVIEKTNDLQAVNEELTAINEELEAKNKIISKQKAELEQTLDYLQSTQMQLLQAEKMASIGLLTSGIAHEINNPLNFISSGVSGLEMESDAILSAIHESGTLIRSAQVKNSAIAALLEKEQGVKESMENIPKLIISLHSGVSRTINIVKGLRTFSRMDDEKKHTASLNEIILGTLTILQSKYKGKIDIHTQFEPDDQIYCYPGKLGQLFLNIIINAIDAIENKGQINIYTSLINEGNAFEIKIEDSGPGIPDELQQKIFDPFFTTKPVGQGTGLGLSISHGIVSDHQGKITVVSEVGKGTCFTILLPKA